MGAARPDRRLEDALGGLVAGLDEVGRGSLSGPVMAAAVILPRDIRPRLAAIVNDSKKLTRPQRDVVVSLLQAAGAYIGIGAASAREIERFNILQATFLAMSRAIRRLPIQPDHVLVDGNQVPPIGLPCTTVIGGDGVSLSIAAASNVAKVLRDQCMSRLAVRYPAYMWDNNAGYGSAAHRGAIITLGPTPHHRRGFGPLLPKSPQHDPSPTKRSPMSTEFGPQ